MVIGGVLENVLGGFKFFKSGGGDGEVIGGGIQAPILATNKIRLQTTSVINPAAEADIDFELSSSKRYRLPEVVGLAVWMEHWL